jgi:hypothetical protein
MASRRGGSAKELKSNHRESCQRLPGLAFRPVSQLPERLHVAERLLAHLLGEHFRVGAAVQIGGVYFGEFAAVPTESVIDFGCLSVAELAGRKRGSIVLPSAFLTIGAFVHTLLPQRSSYIQFNSQMIACIL